LFPNQANLRGLYLIAGEPRISSAELERRVHRAIEGGARLVQYREKGLPPTLRKARAQRLLSACRELGAALLVNDDVALAKAIGAQGVHLGRDDMPLHAARAILGSSKIIGVSCYNALENAHRAAGADYVAFGRFFPSRTKPQAVQADFDLLRRARREIPAPVVAIGGITPENGASLILSGADMLAVGHALLAQKDPFAVARQFAELFA
jgi:thiamine-phosphate pyrophosphorylase